jgi:hypothetical protein
MLQGAEVSRGSKVAVDVGKQGCRSLTLVSGLGARPDEHGSSPLRSKCPALPADAETSSSKIDQFACVRPRLKRSNPFERLVDDAFPRHRV